MPIIFLSRLYTDYTKFSSLSLEKL